MAEGEETDKSCANQLMLKKVGLNFNTHWYEKAGIRFWNKNCNRKIMKVKLIKNKSNSNKDIIMMNSDTSELLKNRPKLLCICNQHRIRRCTFIYLIILPISCSFSNVWNCWEWYSCSMEDNKTKMGTIFLCPDLFNEPFLWQIFWSWYKSGWKKIQITCIRNVSPT